MKNLISRLKCRQRSIVILYTTLIFLCPALSQVFALQWNWEWTPDSSETNPAVSLCQYKYGKTWAYSIEIDDEPAFVATFSVPFFANYKYTDAPPGISGGTARPVVGSVAAFVQRVGGNSTYVSFNDIRTLMLRQGWGVSNHSYAHSGYDYGGGNANILTPAQIREDLFWSQAVFATEVGNGRGLSHFVYPNGWLGYSGVLTGGVSDYTYFTEFGFRSGSLISTSGGTNPYSGSIELRKYVRNYLDDGYWVNNMGAVATAGIPVTPAGNFIIDFTHTMDTNTSSSNFLRWQSRMNYLYTNYGKIGDDSMWSAPTAEVMDYVIAEKAATATISPGHVRLTIPDTAPGAALTLKLTNIPATSTISAPPGGLVYRSGTTVWLTTPFLGQSGTTLAQPRVKRIYQGAVVSTMTFSSMVRLAAVQIHQQGSAPNPFKIDLTTPSGPVNFVNNTTLGSNYGNVVLFSAVPATSGIQTTVMQVTTNSSLTDMSVWVVDESAMTRSTWQTANFSGTEISNGVAADTADPDGDGLNNLTEYGLGTDPHLPDSNALPVARVDANGYLKLTFTRDSTRTDITYTVEGCSDISNSANWTALAQSAGGAPMANNGASSITETGSGTLKTVTVFDCKPASAMNKRYLRLRISR